jgi:mxaJ protein
MSSGSERAVRAARYAGVAILLLAIPAVMLDRHRAADHSPTHLVVPSSEARPAAPDPATLRVCADPNNLPFSNERREGFENAVAELVASDLGRRVEYYWQPQRRGFMRTTLNAGWCDVVMGVPARIETAWTTQPYYRSSYVFISRPSAAPLRSFDDPRLRRLRVGVEMTGEDYENPPALQALAERHIIDNVKGYLVYGDYSTADPPRRIVDAVASGEVDTAIAWGPLAGYFAARSSVPLTLTPVAPEHAEPGLQFAFDIAMAVRRSDVPLHDAIDRAIAAHASEIRAILVRYGVPMVQGVEGA